MTVPFSDMIPELSLWNEGRGIDVEGWICCVGNFEHLIGYLEIIWPVFIEHEACVLRAGFSKESFDGFMRQTNGDKKAVEIVMNHLHGLRIFGDVSVNPTRQQLVHIGRKLKDVWSCKLARDFPDRAFVVSFPEESIETSKTTKLRSFKMLKPSKTGASRVSANTACSEHAPSIKWFWLCCIGASLMRSV